MSAAVAGFAIAVAAVAFLALTLALTLVSLVTLVAVAVLVLATAATEACPWDDADFAGQTVRFAGRSLVFCTAFGATCPRRECGGAASEEAWLLLPTFGAADESVSLLLLLLLLLLDCLPMLPVGWTRTASVAAVSALPPPASGCGTPSGCEPATDSKSWLPS